MRSRIRMAGIAAIAACAPALAQEAGWHYSPFAGEGDRAALGCALESDAMNYTCLAVRCEDDFGVGLYVHTNRVGGDAGRWALTLDRETLAIETAATAGLPYHARVTGDVAPLIDKLKHNARAYLDPETGEGLARNAIPLDGSLFAINQAQYFCAAPPADTESGADAANPSAAPDVEPLNKENSDG